MYYDVLCSAVHKLALVCLSELMQTSLLCCELNKSCWAGVVAKYIGKEELSAYNLSRVQF